MFVLCIHPPSLLISTTILTTKLRSWKVLVKRLFHLRTYPMISFVVLEHVLYETWEVRTRYLWCSVYEWLLLFLFFRLEIFFITIFSILFSSLLSSLDQKFLKNKKKNRYGSQFKNGNFLPTIQLFHGNVCHGSPLPT
jgi:hypothetical protein